MIVTAQAKSVDEQAREHRKRLAGETGEVCCPRCKGSGRVDLPSHLVRTLDTLRMLGPSTSTDLLEDLHSQGEGIQHAGLCNRLATLEDLGLVRRSPIRPSSGKGGRSNAYEVTSHV